MMTLANPKVSPGFASHLPGVTTDRAYPVTLNGADCRFGIHQSVHRDYSCAIHQPGTIFRDFAAEPDVVRDPAFTILTGGFHSKPIRCSGMFDG